MPLEPETDHTPFKSLVFKYVGSCCCCSGLPFILSSSSLEHEVTHRLNIAKINIIQDIFFIVIGGCLYAITHRLYLLITYSFEPAHKLQGNGAGLLHTPLRFTTNLNMIWKAYANTGSALSMFCLLSLFEVVISKAIEQYVCIIITQVQKYKYFFKLLGLFQNTYQSPRIFNISGSIYFPSIVL